MPKKAILCRLAAVLSAFAALLTTACTRTEGNSTSESSSKSSAVSEVTGSFTVTALNVGKADALVLQTANSVTVIDTGNKGDGKDIEKFLTVQGIDTVNTLIITHFDKDHVGGAARVVNRLNVEQIYVPDYAAESDEYEAFIEKAEEMNTPITPLPAKEQREWTADDVSFSLYAAEETFYGKDEENDFSLVLYARHGENTFLFAGDAELARQQEIMSLNLGTVDFLKFPYHGNYLSSTEAFLDACDPKVTVVTCSEKEYADPSTVETLSKRGIETYYCCDGTVTVVSDGKTLVCSQETE